MVLRAGNVLICGMEHENEHINLDQPPSERARLAREELFGDDFTTTEAAYILGFEDKATVLRYARHGLLTGYQLGREWRFPKASLQEFKARLMADGLQVARERKDRRVRHHGGGLHPVHCAEEGNNAVSDEAFRSHMRRRFKFESDTTDSVKRLSQGSESDD
jgi:excisionase family DNA binding protein